MWSDWRADVVEDDFKLLAKHRITTLRVFPLWPVFQPITMLYAGGGAPREYRFGEEPLPDTPEGRAGMSEEALSHFGTFCVLAERYGLRLIVGLITGWMSGRLYIPPALQRLNVLTDPTAVLWETRFVRCFVGRFKRGIGGKPCFAEECGTLGPVFADEEGAADFVMVRLFSLWAHDCLGFLWWCANEQSHLTHAPYDWNSVERELGLFRSNRSPKPVVSVLEDFSELMDMPDLKRLPPRLTDGVCVLSRGQDTWGAAYMTFILAKQAGLDVEFAYSDQNLPEAPLYFLPSISGDASISGRRMKELLERVSAGASLYLSLQSGLLSPFGEYTGLSVISREKSDRTESVTVKNGGGDFVLPLYRVFKLNMETRGAEVLASDSSGNPVYTVYSYGKGKVFFLALPLETGLLSVSHAFDEEERYRDFYRPLKDSIPAVKAAQVLNVNIGLTEHPVDNSRRILVLVNYAPQAAEAKLILKEGWRIDRYYHGSLSMPNNNGTVPGITRRN
jgi:hypothetical protein